MSAKENRWGKDKNDRKVEKESAFSSQENIYYIIYWSYNKETDALWIFFFNMFLDGFNTFVQTF